MNLKYRLVKFEKAVAFQVLFMNERFRCIDHQAPKEIQTSSGVVCSRGYPHIEKEKGLYVSLWGYLKKYDHFVTCTLFDSNGERDLFCDILHKNLKEWGDHFPDTREYPDLLETEIFTI